MPKLNLRGDTIDYESHGSGTPVILIPGLGSDRSLWHWQIDRYAEEFRCILFDNRGVGQSTIDDASLNPERYTLELLASDVNNLMIHLNIEKAHIVGASMGGVIAQYFAILFPEKVLTLSLHSTLSKSAPLVSLHFQSQINMLEEIGVDKLLMSIAPLIWSEETLLHRTDLLTEFRSLRNGRIPPVSKDVYILQAKMLLNFDLTNAIAEFKIPVLVTAGAEDILIHPRNSELIHNAIPNSEYIIFKDCGHASFVEKHKEFNSKTLAFFRKGENNK